MTDDWTPCRICGIPVEGHTREGLLYCLRREANVTPASHSHTGSGTNGDHPQSEDEYTCADAPGAGEDSACKATVRQAVDTMLRCMLGNRLAEAVYSRDDRTVRFFEGGIWVGRGYSKADLVFDLRKLLDEIN